jgi:hypothetical protein
MIAVTVGVGAHYELALIASKLFQEATGITAHILTEEHLQRAGCSSAQVLRFHLFDIFPDAQKIIYFDADLFFHRKWHPEDVFRQCGTKIGAVRDINYGHPIIADFVETMGRAPGDYVNTGLLFLQRAHADLLKTMSAMSPVLAWRSPFVDQAVMNALLRGMDIPVHYLPRVYNWVENSKNFSQAHGIPIIGFHKYKTLQSPQDQIAQFRSSSFPPEGEGPLLEAYQEYSGVYEYWVDGVFSRHIELRPDGTMGAGARRLEASWVVKADGLISIIGLRSFLEPATEFCLCDLRQNGDSFEGTWDYFEKFDVSLRRTEECPEVSSVSGRAAVIAKLLQSVVGTGSPCRVAELGVYRGDLSEYLLSMFPELELTLVDVWSQQGFSPGYLLSGDDVAVQPEAQLKANMCEAIQKVSFASHRVRVWRAKTSEAASWFPEARYDLVFIDADHSYSAVVQDILAWYPRVRSGGILSGHDYLYPEKFGGDVARAVDECVERFGLELHLEDDYVWWVKKP